VQLLCLTHSPLSIHSSSQPTMEHHHQIIHTSSTSTPTDLSKRPKSKNRRVRYSNTPLGNTQEHESPLSVPWLDFAGSKFDYPDAIEPQICPLGRSDIGRAGTSTYVRGVPVVRSVTHGGCAADKRWAERNDSPYGHPYGVTTWWLDNRADYIPRSRPYWLLYASRVVVTCDGYMRPKTARRANISSDRSLPKREGLHGRSSDQGLQENRVGSV